jgi:superfamily I DNA/RNA helicase
VRSSEQIIRARRAVELSASKASELGKSAAGGFKGITIGTMHDAKGLEFRAVVVMACDDGIVPDEQRVEGVADESDLESVYDSERHLLYVACTRARDRLLVTAVQPGSEFLTDFDI